MLPTFFLGHGSPMNAIQDTEFSRGWASIGEKIGLSKSGKPSSVVIVSAHWLTEGTYITKSSNPKTIHDFGGFPKELYEVEYKVPGNPDLAEEIAHTCKYTKIQTDLNWGLDHGTWSILKWIFPSADVPVLQLSIDATKPLLWHYELAAELSSLRKKNILLLGSGNLVHNLALLNWKNMDEKLEWAVESNETFKSIIASKDHRRLATAHAISPEAKLAINSAEHFVPSLYTMGFGKDESHIEFFHDMVQSSISMLSFQMGDWHLTQ
jgi:4,5-DOPA dioxygenase extradiol